MTILIEIFTRTRRRIRDLVIITILILRSRHRSSRMPTIRTRQSGLLRTDLLTPRIDRKITTILQHVTRGSKRRRRRQKIRTRRRKTPIRIGQPIATMIAVDQSSIRRKPRAITKREVTLQPMPLRILPIPPRNVRIPILSPRRRQHPIPAPVRTRNRKPRIRPRCPPRQDVVSDITVIRLDPACVVRTGPIIEQRR